MKVFTMEIVLSLIRQHSQTHGFVQPEERAIFFVPPLPPPPVAAYRTHQEKTLIFSWYKPVSRRCLGPSILGPSYLRPRWPGALGARPRNQKTPPLIDR